MVRATGALVAIAAGLMCGMSASATDAFRVAAVAPALHLAPTGADSNPCTRNRPCASISRAYKLAKAGQRVLLAPGTYGAQPLDDTGRRSGDPVVFDSAGKASLQSLSIHGASNVVFRRLAVAGQILIENEHPERDGSRNVTLDRDSAKTLRLIGRISNITIRGGSYGNAVNAQPQIKKYNPTDPDTAQPTAVLVDGVAFHDFRRSDKSVHTECLQILNGNSITIRNSRFWNCDGTGAIGITPTGLIVDLTIENSFIGGGGDTGYGVQLGMLLRNFVFRNNSSSQSVFFADSKAEGPYTFIGNYMPWDYSLCRVPATYVNNVLAGGKCGSSDVSVPSLQFVDAMNHDLHLPRGSNAVGKGGTRANRLQLDIDGDLRPSRFPADAGADQRESARIVFGRSIGDVTLGQTLASVTAFYGRGSSGSARLGQRRVKRLTYRLHRGALWVYSDKARIVGVATSSGYYQTASGLGPGAPANRKPSGFKWVDCISGYAWASPGANARILTSAGRRGGVIRAIYALSAGYSGCSR